MGRREGGRAARGAGIRELLSPLICGSEGYLLGEWW